MLALIAGSSGFTLAPTAVPRQVTRVAAANVAMQTMADLRFFVSGSEARTTLAVVVCDGLAGSQRPPVSHLSVALSPIGAQQRFDTDQSQSIDKQEFLAMQSPSTVTV